VLLAAGDDIFISYFTAFCVWVDDLQSGPKVYTVEIHLISVNPWVQSCIAGNRCIYAIVAQELS